MEIKFGKKAMEIKFCDTNVGIKYGDRRVWWLIIIASLFVSAFFILFVSIDMEDMDNMLYLLSTIPQVIGAMFAIIFTLFLIHLEIIINKSPTDKEIGKKIKEDMFELPTVIYIVGTLFSILYPLLLLSVWKKGGIWVPVIGELTNLVGSQFVIKLSLISATLAVIGTPFFIFRLCKKISRLC